MDDPGSAQQVQMIAILDRNIHGHGLGAWQQRQALQQAHESAWRRRHHFSTRNEGCFSLVGDHLSARSLPQIRQAANVVQMVVGDNDSDQVVSG
jgi:hypothetical protein